MLSVGISFTICSGLFMVLLTIVYFSKKRIPTIENKIFTYLILINLFGSLIGVPTYYVTKYAEVVPFLFYVIARLYLVFTISWLYCFTLYIYAISFNRDQELKKKNTKKVIKYTFPFLILSILCVFILPLYYNNTNNEIYTYGPSTTAIYIAAGCCVISWVVFAIKDIKNIRSRKYIPLFSMAILGSISILLQHENPSLLVLTTAIVLNTTITYFTLENPDVQTIDLLMRNRELVEQSVNEKSNFLFKVSQELKNPIKEIIHDVKVLKTTTNEEKHKESIELIEHSANKAYFIINDVSNITSMDVKSLKVQNNTYDTKRFFKELEANTRNRIKMSEKENLIDFRFKVNTSCPDSLYGDNIKLKQVLLSIINNSIKYTKKGFIDIEVDSLVRYDACRLLITISDSGCGMPIYKVNELLSKNEEINEEVFQNIDNQNLNIPVANKLLKLLGGNMNINSKEGEGTVVTIVINQEINYNSTQIVLNDVSKYNIDTQNRKRVLVADDGPDLDKLERMLSKNNLDVITTLIGKDVIDKIENGDKYDLIILKDNLKPDTAYSILKKLQENKKFKTPVIVTIDKSQEFIKDHFIKDGFSDVITRENIDNDLQKVISKYI